MESPTAYVQQRVDEISPEDLQRRPNKWLATFPGSDPARRVLDVACGMGYDSFAWARDGKVVVATDVNLGLIRAASRLANDLGLTVHFVVADATNLPFREGSFDLGYSENLLEHVPKWQAVAEEVQRVLRSGGRAFFRTTNRSCPRNPEINHLHLYPWFPEWMKKPILRWVMKNRPAWVNYTSFPAVNWFTHRGLSAKLHAMGFRTYEIFDLIRTDDIRARNRPLLPILRGLKRFPYLRYLAYPWMRSVQILAVKRT